ncbi:acyltransferase family protein [Castellaniella sp.]|uniref:acyltransferase family protein n=1 Tax=Castellaniella sp. TaxID=1955812 RepID=UPI003C767A24
MNHQVIRYRADIDGLRAVAVLSVLLFHINFNWVPGGYTGVDIFFVISGYLITGIIGREIEQGRFSLRAFYVRRIRRILPVFYVVLACSAAAGAVLLLPADLHAFLASLRRALYFTANVYFSKDRGYFDIAADEKPLLHTWSLSIEEQFYFIWPLTLLLFYAIGTRFFKQRRVVNQSATIALTACLAVAGIAYAQWMLVQHPGETRWYFLLQTRFSELMIGALIAIVPFRSSSAAWRRAMAWLGGLLIALGLFALTKNSLFPGLNALLPCTGAALLIYSGQGVETPTWPHELLAHRAMAGLGLLSYSMYLWHWPVLAYMRYVYGSYALPWLWVVGVVASTIALSLLSYQYVECRTKSLAVTFPRAFLGIFLIPAALLAACTYWVQAVRPVTPQPAELTSYGTDVCHGNFSKRCVRGAPGKQPTVLVIGDSHAAALNEFIDVVGRHEGWAARVLTASSCSPMFGYDEKVLPSWAQKPCVDLKAYVSDHYAEYDAVVIASFWAYQLGMTEIQADPHYLDRLTETLHKISVSVPVYVVSDVPRLSVSPFREIYFQRLGLNVKRPSSRVTMRANSIVRNVVEKVANTRWIDLGSTLANFQRGGYQGKPTYFDEQHLNVYGARELGALFVKDHRLF